MTAYLYLCFAILLFGYVIGFLLPFLFSAPSTLLVVIGVLIGFALPPVFLKIAKKVLSDKSVQAILSKIKE
jgi:flagellar biosynthesis protein FliR